MTSLNPLPLMALCASIFTAGLLGSWHCGFMCGPMACYLADKKQLIPYQFGRLISYVLAGLFAGFITQFFFQSYDWIKYISVFGMSGLLIWMAFQKKVSFQTPAYLNNFYFKNKHSSFLLGFFSFLLPCGWLYTFIVSASATRSAYAGALVMFIFWISTLPALTAAQVVLRKMIHQTNDRTQKISSIVLLIAGIYNLFTFLFLHR